MAEKIAYITTYARETLRVQVPTLDLNFKAFRDLIIHPYIRKSLPAKADGHRREIGQTDIFDLTLDDARTAGAMVDEWLGVVTSLYEYPRGYDTRRLAEDLAVKIAADYRERLGQLPTDIEAKTYRI